MTIYVPNIGEKEMLKDILLNQGIVLGLYSNQVVPDGNTIIDTLTEMATGGSPTPRGYAPIALTNDLCEDLLTAAKWFISYNAAGKAQGQYATAAQEWIFNAVDVADGKTVYGVFCYTWVLPFDTGLVAGAGLKIGDTLIGAAGATGIITAICVQSGTWAGNTAAGYFCIKTKTGTFVDSELLHITGPTNVASTNTGATADAHKRLMLVEPFPSGYAIDMVGKKITYQPIITLSTA